VTEVEDLKKDEAEGRIVSVHFVNGAGFHLTLVFLQLHGWAQDYF
jgi:hypothetical protein